MASEYIIIMLQVPTLFPPFPIDLSPIFTVLVKMIKDPSVFWHLMSTSQTFMTIQVFLLFISAILFIGIAFVVKKINETNGKVNAKRKSDALAKREQYAGVKSKRFDTAQKYIESDNPSEWRLAIIEADALLEEMVKKMGYEGTTLGEMMKNIERSDFTTIDEAWEAHKVRNQIAHHGSSFSLTKREAKRIMQMYEKVFREFGII